MAADPIRIVYVEDDADNVYVLTRRLGRRGYDVTVASDGAAGIETVYQDLAVAPSLDIASNIFLGRERRRSDPLGFVHPLVRAAFRPLARGTEPVARITVSARTFPIAFRMSQSARDHIWPSWCNAPFKSSG